MIQPEFKTKVTNAVDCLKDELVQLVCDLVRIPSVNPTYPGEIYEKRLGGETKVAEFLKPLLDGIGLKTDIWDKEKGRSNLVGTYKGCEGGKSLIFNGHIDVVPPGAEEKWNMGGPWSGSIDGERIWGRGSCDMKGGCACAFIALKALLNAGFKPKGNVILEYVVGEEMMNTPAGTGATIERGYTADAAIVVEPSCPPYRLGLLTASSGVFYMVVTIEGKAVHASLRDELIRPGGQGASVGVSSIDKAIIIYQGLRRLEDIWGQTKSHPMFTRPGHFTLHPGVITGGPSGPFVISDESRIEYAIFHSPYDSEEQVKKEVEEQITLFAQTDPWLREHPPKVEWPLWWPPYDIPVDSPICKAVAKSYEAAIGKPVKYHGLCAVDDATFLNKAGIPTVTIGPGDVNVAHAVNEYVEISELVDAAKIYALSIVEWCGVDGSKKS